MPDKQLPRDSVIAYIPLSVTADLGVAMRRVRAKRIAQIKEVCPTLFQNDNYDDGNDADLCNAQEQDDPKNSSNTRNRNDNRMDNSNDSDNVESQDEELENDRMLMSGGTASSSNGIRREQFGSIVEYLEAKYARGVMIDDLDERIRERKKKKKKKRGKDSNDGLGTNNENKNSTGGEKDHNGDDSDDGDDMSVLSDSAAGSCYSIESGNFIDDSELRKEVAHQILGSSAYGKTKIEAVSRDRAAAAAKKNENDDESLEDCDHEFFVNVGDLEMEDGWKEHDLDDDEDWIKMMAKAKGKKRKRASKDNSNSKDGEKVKKKVKKDQQNSNNDDKKKNSKSNSSSGSNTNEKKKTKSSNTEKDKKKTQNKTKNSSSSSKKSTSKSTNTTSEKSDNNTTLASIKKSNNDDSGKKKKSGDGKKTESSSSKKEKPAKISDEQKAEIDAAKRDCNNLKRKVARMFKKCVDEIKKMTPENLPVKSNKGGKSKVSITVPEGKKTGDKISFNNPHDPSQKLQVLIPENCEAGETFKVSVPMPVASKGENKFTKECIQALHEYSLLYDEWCQAEATHRELLPPSSKKKAGSFKVGTERLKKYDAMLEEFPKNLETPIDAPFLRKVVRRKRQNDNKRLRLLEESLTPTKKTEVKVEVKPEVVEKPKKKRGPVQMSLTLPKKSSKFREVVFALNDFEKK